MNTTSCDELVDHESSPSSSSSESKSRKEIYVREREEEEELPLLDLMEEGAFCTCVCRPNARTFVVTLRRRAGDGRFTGDNSPPPLGDEVEERLGGPPSSNEGFRTCIVGVVGDSGRLVWEDHVSGMAGRDFLTLSRRDAALRACRRRA